MASGPTVAVTVVAPWPKSTTTNKHIKSRRCLSQSHRQPSTQHTTHAHTHTHTMKLTKECSISRDEIQKILDSPIPYDGEGEEDKAKVSERKTVCALCGERMSHSPSFVISRFLCSTFSFRHFNNMTTTKRTHAPTHSTSY